MPRGNERITGNIERAVRGEGKALSRRSNRTIHNSCSKVQQEQSSSSPGLRNSEQRCTFIWVAVEHESCRILVPLFSFFQGNEGTNQSSPEHQTSLYCLESLEQRSNLPERPGSAESSTGSSSSGVSILAKSCSRRKQAKSVKKISTAPQASAVSNSTSGSGFDGFDLVPLVKSVDSISKMEKTVKKSSKKKRKKKGKQYKRSGQKKVSIASQSEEGTYHVSVSETSISSQPASPWKHSSRNMMDRVASPVSAVRDTEGDSNTEDSDNRRNNSATTLTYTSCNDETYNLELLDSDPWAVSGKKPIPARCENAKHVMSSSTSASSEIVLSTSSENTPNVHQKQNGIHLKQRKDPASISDDQNSSLVPYSLLDNLKNDAFENSSVVKKHSITLEQSNVKDYFLEGGLVMDSAEHSDPVHSITADSCNGSIEMSSYCSMDRSDESDYVVDAENTDERVQCSSEASSSNDFQPVVYRRRGRLVRKASSNSNSLCRSGRANLIGWAGKKINHPICQKSQKNGTQGCIRGSKSDNLVYQHVEMSSKGSEVQEIFDKVERWNKNETGPLCSSPFSDEEIVETALPTESESSDVSINNSPSRNNHERLSKEFQENLQRAPVCKKGVIDELRNSKVKVARESNIQIQEESEMSIQVIDHQQIGSHSTSFSAAEVDCCQSESLHDRQIFSSEPQNGTSSLSTESGLLEKTSTKVHSSCANINNEDSQTMQLETQSLHIASSLDVPIISELTFDNLNSGKVKLQSPNLDSHHLVLSNGGSSHLSCHSQEPESECFMPNEADKLSHRSGSSGAVEGHAMVTRNFTVFEADLCKIMQVVDESYKLLRASDVIRQMTGAPVAEFERLLYSVSPSVSQSIWNCKICSRDEMVDDALCIHEIPHISLGNLWQWYEKPGSYGLEVKVEDLLNPKRSRNGCSQFRAYFVPYLSSIQLFARSRSSVCVNNDVSGIEAKQFGEEGKTAQSPGSLKSLPIFSMLLPQPYKIVPSDKNQVCFPKVNSSNFTDGELLFEYFEAEQPQQRRPLFDKIKELVKGGTSCNCEMFGDPSSLECLDLHDLHPASWFSVAWYPIYRIPDGKLRAAFLTYHSLGQLVHRSTLCNVARDITQIVSPVVGVQSYNAKGECWFVQREFGPDVGQWGKLMLPNPSETVRARLRTLEHAASVMSRATVCKGSKKSVNKHPDYEFFLSRGR